jgi:hypothetical protein
VRAAALGILVLAVAAGALSMRDRLIGRMLFYPTPGVDWSPASLGIEASEVFLTTEDGVRIHAFHLPAPAARRALLFLHGNAGNASHRLPNAELLRRLGADVLLLEYRGYGRSEGRPDEAGLYADARAGLAYIEGELAFPERRVVVFGRSLGGAVAVDLAAGRDLGGVILESTFSSLSDEAARAFGWPGALIARGRFDSAAKIGRVRAPLLFIHGDRDEVVSVELGRRLYERATAVKSFETLHGAGHDDTVAVGGAAYLSRIARFLDEVTP